jgi:hypothetical protein
MKRRIQEVQDKGSSGYIKLKGRQAQDTARTVHQAEDTTNSRQTPQQVTAITTKAYTSHKTTPDPSNPEESPLLEGWS